MKAKWILIGCLFFAGALRAQQTPTVDDWRTDLRFLQETVHRDYPFLFKKTTAAEFDRQVAELDAALPALQPHEILAGFARLVASFQYGHTAMDMHAGPVSFRMAPLLLYEFSDGIYVVAAAADCSELVGAQVLAIEGVPIDEACRRIRPLVPAENDQFFKAHGLHYLGVPEALHAQRITLQLQTTISYLCQKDGRQFTHTVETVPGRRINSRYGFVSADAGWLDARDDGERPFYLRNLERRYEFTYIPESKTVYVRHSEIQDDPNEPIPAFYRRVFQFVEEHDVEKLVLDVRLNGGGNNYKNKPILQEILRCEKINQPGKLFVILGRRTFSACQNLVNELDNYTSAIFVGEPTSENINFYGDNRRVELPRSKIPIFLSFAWWQDKPQWENADWLAPDLPVETSFADYRQNRDPVLDAILQMDTSDLEPDPLGRLRELFEAGRVDDVRAAAKKFATDPRYKFVELERQLNEAGYGLLRGDKRQEAQFVFELVTELYPESPNAWDSLGEFCWEAKQAEQAIEHYTKASQLDPTGQIGDNARRMLERIRHATEKGANQ